MTGIIEFILTALKPSLQLCARQFIALGVKNASPKIVYITIFKIAISFCHTWNIYKKQYCKVQPGPPWKSVHVVVLSHKLMDSRCSLASNTVFISGLYDKEIMLRSMKQSEGQQKKAGR